MVIRLDRFTKAILTLLVVGVWGLLLSFVFQGQPVAAQGNANNVVKWEYDWDVLGWRNKEHYAKATKRGENGWEMFAVTDATSEQTTYFYRRRKN
jgi:hypothetical protein